MIISSLSSEEEDGQAVLLLKDGGQMLFVNHLPDDVA